VYFWQVRRGERSSFGSTRNGAEERRTEEDQEDLQCAEGLREIERVLPPVEDWDLSNGKPGGSE